MGYESQLYYVDSSLNLLTMRDNYCSLGTGQDVANGALSILTKMEITDPEDILVEALETVEYHTSGISGPYTILRCSDD